MLRNEGFVDDHDALGIARLEFAAGEKPDPHSPEEARGDRRLNRAGALKIAALKADERSHHERKGPSDGRLLGERRRIDAADALDSIDELGLHGRVDAFCVEGEENDVIGREAEIDVRESFEGEQQQAGAEEHHKTECNLTAKKWSNGANR